MSCIAQGNRTPFNPGAKPIEERIDNLQRLAGPVVERDPRKRRVAPRSHGMRAGHWGKHPGALGFDRKKEAGAAAGKTVRTHCGRFLSDVVQAGFPCMS